MNIARPTIQGRNRFDAVVQIVTGSDLHAQSLSTIQVNIGLTCNLACHHCHVESTPKRTEQMTWETIEQVLAAAEASGAETIDITGGAPEMNPHFCRFVSAATDQGLRVMVRTNLTIMLVDGYQNMPSFFADHRVHLVASLPCYLEENVDKQRGRRVYQDSIDVIQKLNGVGYGRKDGLVLDLVYNPGGPSLPPAQAELELDYKRELAERFDIHFSNLFTITNMAIGRFLHDLQRDHQADQYEQLLRDAFNPQTVDPLMCRHQIHVSHDGTCHDCDFNYALEMPCTNGAPLHIREFDPARWRTRRIVTGEHCFGCTAGSGSSCGGSLVGE
jgi:radical SAM/Cys-rich protein